MSNGENNSGGEKNSSGENNSVKEMLQKVGNKFEEKWDVDKQPNKLEEKWDITKNPSSQDKWDVHKNAGTASQKKNAVLKDILYGVVAKLADKWDAHEDSKSEEAQTGEERSATSGKVDGKEDSQKNHEKQETGSVEASSRSDSSPDR